MHIFEILSKNTEQMCIRDRSDVDLLISMPLNGLRFYELVEMLRESLKKKVDLLDESQLENNCLLYTSRGGPPVHTGRIVGDGA